MSITAAPLLALAWCTALHIRPHLPSSSLPAYRCTWLISELPLLFCCPCSLSAAAGQAHVTLADAAAGKWYRSVRKTDEGVFATLRPLYGTGVTSIVSRNNLHTPAAALRGLTGVYFGYGYLKGAVQEVCQLAQLRQLKLESTHMTGSWRQLSALTKLERLALDDRAVDEVLEVLPALVALTHLELADFTRPVHSWQSLRGAPQLPGPGCARLQCAGCAAAPAGTAAAGALEDYVV